jgi:hypothetical protein
MQAMDKPTPEQRRKAVITAIILAVMVFGIYGVFMFKFYART